MDWHDAETGRQIVVRAANEGFQGADGRSRDALVEYRCECGDARCLSTILLTDEEYGAARGHGARFLIACDHENPETDIVVAQTASFAFVEKFAGRQRDLAVEKDPRRRE